MLVKIVPIRPIPGILPKNKWIDSEIVLDLNKNEIIHCMQYGNVYDENGNIMDAISIHKKAIVNQKPKAVETIKTVEVEPVEVKEYPIVILPEPVKEEEVVIMSPITVEEPVEEPVVETVEEYFNLKVLAHIKEENSIILVTEMNTNSKLEGNLYGLFNVVSGPRPTLEYKVEDEWVKFNNKFANFETVENGDKFVFRLTPKNNNEFTYKFLIKQANEILLSFEEKINPEKI